MIHREQSDTMIRCRVPQPPDPATVRPQVVLEEAMEKISGKWARGGMDDYIYACSQLKAIRQDLVVRVKRGALWIAVISNKTLDCYQFSSITLDQQYYFMLLSLMLTLTHFLLHLCAPQQVQRIKNAFTVKVYEGHARIALQQVRWA